MALGAGTATITNASIADVTANPSLFLDPLLPAGLQVDYSSVQIVGANTFVGNTLVSSSIGTFSNFTDPNLALGSGILITSGMMPGLTNTSTSFGASLNMAGNAALDAVVNSVFQTASYDATMLSFDFNVNDLSVTGISFNIAFGSDEFPEWVNQFVDVGVVLVNGVNYAYFGGAGNTTAPLSVVNQNLTAGYFQNNTTGAIPIEYDGMSKILTIFAPVHQGLNSVTFGIADTGDHILDSGLFISNMQTTTLPSTGVHLDVDGTQNDDSLQGSSASEYIVAQAGDDSINGGAGDDIISGGAGNDSMSGGAGEDYLDGGDGIDTAFYAGLASTYEVVTLADGSVEVTDTATGSTDTLAHVEVVQFADATLDLTGALTGPGTAPVVEPPPAAPQAVDAAVVVTQGTIAFDDPDFGGTHGVTVVPPVPALSGVTLVAVVTVEPGVGTPGEITWTLTVDSSDPAIQALPAGAVLPTSFALEITDSAGLTTVTSLDIDIVGIDDAPVATPGAVTTDEDTSVSADALAGAYDPDGATAFDVVLGAQPLPDGVTYDSLTHSFHLDTTLAAFQQLLPGETVTVTVPYGLSDGVTTTPTSISFEVTGVNDAPTVSGPVLASPNEGTGTVLIDALATATDPDAHKGLSVIAPADLPAGLTYDAATHKFVFDTSNAAYAGLAKGEILDLTVHYLVSDGDLSTAATAIISITGTNEAPVVSGIVSASGMESGAPIAIDLLAAASDVDGNLLSILGSKGGTVVAHAMVGTTAWADPVVFTLSGSTLTLNPAQFAALHAGQDAVISFDYQVTDGNAGGQAAAHAQITVHGQDLGLSLVGTAKNDILNGSDGADTIDGSGGSDVLRGGAGDDVFVVRGSEAATDSMDGGTGIDTLKVAGTGALALNGFAATNIEIWSGNGHELIGSGKDDTFNLAKLAVSGLTFVDAGSGNDKIYGYAGGGDLRGNSGNDLIVGGSGNDTISGGVGNDVMTGGAGQDRFAFDKGFNIDHITDFQHGVDTLDFSKSLFANEAAVVAATRVVGDSLVISAGGHSVTLDGVSSISSIAGDILFH